jgi:hypothetical protein
MSSIRIDQDMQAERNAPQAGPAPRGYFRDERLKSPLLAGVFSLVPGLGQIYIGYYGQGFINILVVASIITLLNRGGEGGELTPFLAIFLVFFWLYNIVDAARRATLYNQSLEGITPAELLLTMQMPETHGSLFWGALLIVAGFITLAHTAYGLSLAWLERWWPAAFILMGAYLLFRSIQARSKPSE